MHLYYNHPHLTTGGPSQPRVAHYLTGTGNEPCLPIRPQDVAVGHLQAQLNSGVFDGTRSSVQAVPRTWQELSAMHPVPPPVTAPTITQKMFTINFHIPVRKEGDLERIANREFNAENVPEDFLTTTAEILGIKEDNEHDLAWKDSDEKVKAPWHDLHSVDDVEQAFGKCRKMLSSTKHQKPVYLTVKDRKADHLPMKDGKKGKKDTPTAESETGCDKEFRAAKIKLFCHAHSKPGLHPDDPGAVYCHIKKNGQHSSLPLSVVSLWARLAHDGKAPDSDYINPPEGTAFDDVNSSAQSNLYSSTRSHRQNSAVHIHFDDGFMKEIRGDGLSSSRKRKCVPSVGSDDVAVEGEKENLQAQPSESRSKFESMHIDQILDVVDRKYLDLNYHQYRQKLVDEGILYGISIYTFERDFFVQEIGMLRGAVGPFLHELHYDKKWLCREPLGAAQGRGN
ncbi:hypothetical protein E1B28_006758 [Marasmius oreades]|uniref:Uncharacterized protein n=1 Tax=Marasmius oreades TaxID=181124 RepID=A0A9P7UWR5_9AGAR|nr:uncharacterized protein E1B28_006758 [Marasmius oreades]KAG7096077.1 hypothetical protein E1B28_006758 [Marasmius oreades]